MDGTRLQQLVDRGYALSADRIGTPYAFYRPTGPFLPLSNSPYATLPAAFSAADYKFAKPNSYGKPTWQALFDGAQTEVGDILVGASRFFIAAQQPILPILVVEAPRLVDVRRPFRESGVGFQEAYGGTTPAQETPVMTGWPCSILQGTKGENTGSGLPNANRNPWYNILLPYWPGVTLYTSDFLVDDLGRRYIVSSTELTDLGWRLTAAAAQA